MRLRALFPGFCSGTLLLMTGLYVAWPAAADELKDQAIARLAASHDPEIPVAIGRVVVRQAGLKAIRQRLADAGRREVLGPGWNRDAPEWQAAERKIEAAIDDVIVTQLEQGAWLQEGWARVAASVLNGEEADEIAAHFATEGGRQQRIVVELLIVGETVLANYTFTDRLDYRVKGTADEIGKLQEIWWSREPFRVRKFDQYPGAIRFAGENPGVKYTKALAIQGIEVVTRRIDAAAAEAATRAASIDLDPDIEAFRRRMSGSR